MINLPIKIFGVQNLEKALDFFFEVVYNITITL